MHDHRQRHGHGRGGHGSHGPGHRPHGSGHPGQHGPGHPGPGHHGPDGSRGLGRPSLEPRYEGLGARQAGPGEQTSPASRAPTGEGCPKRGGSAECPGDCRICPNRE